MIPNKKDHKIAIIGMISRFPGANNPDAFWDNISKKRESISKFSEHDLHISGISDEQIDNANYVPARGIVDDIASFDANFFGISSKEAKLMDPQHRLFLESCYEALEDAGYSKDSSQPIGVFAGSSNSLYYLHNLYPNKDFRNDSDEYLSHIGNEKDYLTTRVSYKLNLKGPSLAIQTACSSSLVSICVACDHLFSNQCDIAIAGGVSLSIPQKRGYLYQNGMIFSPDGHCRSFDKKAEGTVPGSGVGVVVLKPLDQALKDNDHIYSVISGYGMNNDGGEKIGFTAPGIEGQVEAVSLAIKKADIHPETIGYIETHGTATPLGDPIEIHALDRAFKAQTQRTGYCAIGSIKSNIGHLMEAAGVAGFIKCSLALNHQMLPPSLHFDTPNPTIDFAKTPFYVNTELKNWEKKSHPRRALVSSLGFGGTNACILLEEAPILPTIQNKNRDELIILSAKSEWALNQMFSRLKNHLLKNPEFSLRDISYTLQVGRKSFSYREAIMCSNKEELLARLSYDHQTFESVDLKPDVIFILPDIQDEWTNTSQYLYEKEPCFRDSIDHLIELSKKYFDINLRPFLCCEALDIKNPSLQDQKKEVVNLSYFIISYSLFLLWKSRGLFPDRIITWGIGRYLEGYIENPGILKETMEKVMTYSNSSIPLNKHLSVFQDLLKRPNQAIIEVGPGSSVCRFIKTNQLTHRENIISPSLPTVEKDSSKFHLSLLGKLWSRGLDIDWGRLCVNNQSHRISLPTYPFKKKEFWIYPPTKDSSTTNTPKVHKEINHSLNHLERSLRSIWQEALALESIGIHDDFFHLGGDSLLAIQITSKIQELFQISIRSNMLLEYSTIEKLGKAIHQQIQVKDSTHLVVKLKDGNTNQPLFCMHPISGSVFCYKDLVEALKHDSAIYGLESPDYEIGDHISIEKIAAKYIQLIRKIQPKGPYQLLGTSFGGLIAYEMAIRLKEESEDISLLAMLDIICPEKLPHKVQVDTETEMITTLAELFSANPKLAEELKGLSRHDQIEILMKSMHFEPSSFSEKEKLFEKMKVHWLAFDNYKPKKYFGDVLFFEAEDRLSSIADITVSSTWHHLIEGSIENHEVAGNHISMLMQPNITDLAKRLNVYLKNYQTKLHSKLET